MSCVVLTVENSLTRRGAVKAALESGGYAVVEAGNAQDALDLAQQRQVDAVIADANMPGMDGITLIARLRELPRYRSTPLLMLVSDSGDVRRSEGRKAGVTGWIAEPFEPRELLATLARVV